MNFLTSTIQVQGWVFIPTIFFLAFAGIRWSKGTNIDAVIKLSFFAVCIVLLYYIFK